MKINRSEDIFLRITNHLLQGQDIAFVSSPNRGGPYEAGALDTIIMHYTAGGDAASAIQTLTDVERQVSAHLVIGRDGSITQLLPFDVIGWHAGVSRWGEREGFNKYSIGIEIDNAGLLEEKDGDFVSWFGRSYPLKEVVKGIHRNQTKHSFWHAFPQAQIDVVESICRVLIEEYRISHILGHEEIAPDRKIDPGPAFPLDDFRARLLPRPYPLTKSLLKRGTK